MGMGKQEKGVFTRAREELQIKRLAITFCKIHTLALFIVMLIRFGSDLLKS